MDGVKKRYTFSVSENTFPLFIESIGYNPREQDFTRPEGYPYYHWLQTLAGEGRFHFGGHEWVLSLGKGILLLPYTPHSYFTVGSQWTTVYVTFGGAAVPSILNGLGIHFSAVYEEKEPLPFSKIVFEMLQMVERDSEFSRLESSAHLYYFLIMLKQYGKINNQSSLSSHYDRIRPLVEWLEAEVAQPISLDEMAAYARMSPQYLNQIFQNAFGISPYSFLIQLRIRKAKEILVSNPEIPLKNVAKLVGFRDLSHFVATFRKKEGITPKKYRDLHT
ncbi:helix-turn-helix transcriptional regulator [Desmospora activa]|uniref:AraC-like protein n=1 Tax=Desmospora activa DSM 45169 TaxID=1121389 RepID=A0A2T4ZD06_9BACL|nr:AraC family transcriptional regulator [Desmospora activa]PTM59778.1 AraC-like protein [Desmospora activa DSM 45169]